MEYDEDVVLDLLGRKPWILDRLSVDDTVRLLRRYRKLCCEEFCSHIINVFLASGQLGWCVRRVLDYAPLSLVERAVLRDPLLLYSLSDARIDSLSDDVLVSTVSKLDEERFARLVEQKPKIIYRLACADSRGSFRSLISKYASRSILFSLEDHELAVVLEYLGVEKYVYVVSRRPSIIKYLSNGAVGIIGNYIVGNENILSRIDAGSLLRVIKHVSIDTLRDMVISRPELLSNDQLAQYLLQKLPDVVLRYHKYIGRDILVGFLENCGKEKFLKYIRSISALCSLDFVKRVVGSKIYGWIPRDCFIRIIKNTAAKDILENLDVFPLELWRDIFDVLHDAYGDGLVDELLNVLSDRNANMIFLLLLAMDSPDAFVALARVSGMLSGEFVEISRYVFESGSVSPDVLRRIIVRYPVIVSVLREEDLGIVFGLTERVLDRYPRAIDRLLSVGGRVSEEALLWLAKKVHSGEYSVREALEIIFARTRPFDVMVFKHVKSPQESVDAVNKALGR